MSAIDNSTPLAAARSFLACIKSRDKESMRALCYPNATACLIREGQPLHMLITDVLDKIPEGGEWGDDEISYDEVEHVDGEFATVWTPYRYFDFGKLHHTGSNNFCLWNSPERGWLITAVQDVARRAEGVTKFNIVGGHDV